MYVQGLPQGTNKEEVRDLFKRFGEIESIAVNPKQRETFYVCLKKPADALQAVEELNKTEYKGSTLLVQKFISRHENFNKGPQSMLSPIAENMKKTYDNTIFVNFIALETSEDQVRALFEQTGEILNLRMIKKPQRYVQSATIMYKEFQGAQKAIQKFHDTRELSASKPLVVDLWQSKEEMQQE